MSRGMIDVQKLHMFKVYNLKKIRCSICTWNLHNEDSEHYLPKKFLHVPLFLNLVQATID